MPEERLRHSHFRHLKYHVAGMADHPGSYPDELVSLSPATWEIRVEILRSQFSMDLTFRRFQHELVDPVFEIEGVEVQLFAGQLDSLSR